MGKCILIINTSTVYSCEHIHFTLYTSKDYSVVLSLRISKPLIFAMKVLIVLIGLVAISLSLPGPHQPKVTCGKTKDIVVQQPNCTCQIFTFDKSYPNHLDYAATSINYCEFDGNFVFYSEKNFKVHNITTVSYTHLTLPTICSV